MALVPDQKFSTFDNGGDLQVGDIIVGLRNGLNTRFNYTGQLPLGFIVPVSQGGTDANNVVDARTNLGLGTMATQNANNVNITGGTAALTSLTLATALAKTSGGTGVTSATTTPTANEFAAWNADLNLRANNFIEGFATTATAGGTTTLTVASAGIQEFTGASTQTVVMPVAATLVAGHTFKIINNSSGNLTLNSSGGNLILTMAANTTAFVTCVLNSGTTAASWNASYVFDNGAGVLSITGTANQVIASASTGAVTLSLPQDINTSSSPTFAGLTAANFIFSSNQMQHAGDTNNYFEFGTDTQNFVTGGSSRMDLSDSGFRLGAANARVTTILDDDTMAGASNTNLYTGLAIKTYVDDAVTNLGVITPWVAYTPTFTGFGTVSSVEVWSRRVGDTLQIRGRFTSGTSTAVEARVTLGFNGTNSNVSSSNTTITNIQMCGITTPDTAQTGTQFNLIQANSGYFGFGLQSGASGGLTLLNGNSVALSGWVISFKVDIPVDVWP